jgi:choline dehydrogenase-like flavoprotein
VAFRQARILGGGSSVMGMVALRGTPHDYAEWVELGAAGWGWDDVLPYFCRLETDTDMPKSGATATRTATMGRCRSAACRKRSGRRCCARWPLMAATGRITRIEDFNADFRDGIGALPISRFADRRASAAICYLDAATRARPNLTIATGTDVQGLVFEGKRVTGVTARLGGTTKSFGAGTVIVSAGALQSPVMLLRAGIGPADHLTACGIPVVADRPGVGANLHNHQVLLLTAHLTRAALPPAGQRAHTTATWRYSSGIRRLPAVDMCIPFVGQTGWHALGRRLSALTPTVLKPFSRGRVRLDPANPAGPPTSSSISRATTATVSATPRRCGARRNGCCRPRYGRCGAAPSGRAHRPAAPAERRHPLQRSARAADRHGAGHDPGGEPADPRHHVVSRARYRDARARRCRTRRFRAARRVGQRAPRRHLPDGPRRRSDRRHRHCRPRPRRRRPARGRRLGDAVGAARQHQHPDDHGRREDGRHDSRGA